MTGNPTYMNTDFNSEAATKHPGVPVIGIAGGIGSGKSVVSRVLRLNGVPVYDCDHEAKRLMEEPEGRIRKELVALFGPDIYKEDGRLDRMRLAEEIFGSAKSLLRVNELVHGEVRLDAERFIQAHAMREEGSPDSGSRPQVVGVESAILESSGLALICDEVWEVTAPEEVRVERAVGRGMAAEDARARMKVQQAESRRLAECGVKVVRIDNDTAGLLRQVLPALASLSETETNKQS